MKSILTGLITVVAAAILLLMTVVVLSSIPLATPQGGTISIDPVALAKSPPFDWVLPLVGFVVFMLGFFWRYRRLRNS